MGGIRPEYNQRWLGDAAPAAVPAARTAIQALPARWRLRKDVGTTRMVDNAPVGDSAKLHGRDEIPSQSFREITMKLAMMVALMVLASGAWAADCVTNARGKTVCTNGEKAVVVNPNTGTVTKAQTNPGGVATVQNSNGTKAAVNPRTGNAAVAQTNQHGVTTTRTARGGQAKTKNGMGVAEGPNGTVCAKGVNNQGCTKK